MMDICTSTPLIMPKADTKAQIQNRKNTLRQQLFQNNVATSEKLDNNQWDFLKGPHFVDFGTRISDPHDSFFDTQKSDQGTPKNHLGLPFSTAAEGDSLINCLRNCSISEIESDVENTTLKASAADNADNIFGKLTIPESMPVDNESTNKSAERRQSTTVQPFSFEIREKEKQERKQARVQYIKMGNEQLNAGEFRAKPAPKFKALPKVTNIEPMKVRKEPIKPTTAVPRQVNNKAMHVFGVNPTTKCNTQSQSKNVLPLIVVEDHTMENVQKVNHIQEKEGDVKSNNQAALQKTEPWKKKPFQVSLPKRRLTVPQSPNLLTAQRARSWKEYTEKMLEKEKQELELLKRRIALKNQREKDDIAILRKRTVHKAVPVPQYLNIPKRPPVDPLHPIFIKRCRRM